MRVQLYAAVRPDVSCLAQPRPGTKRCTEHLADAIISCMGDASEQEQNGSLGSNLLDSIYSTWVEPEISRRKLQLARHEVTKVVVEIDPADPQPRVMLNNEAQVIAEVRVTRAISAGEPVTPGDFDKVSNIRPASVGPNSGWVCFAVIEGEAVIAFDFRYNRAQVRRLLRLARDFLTAAHAAAAASPAVACDTAFSAAELSVHAQMLLQQQVTKNHWRRQDWLDEWARLENAPTAHSQALRELHRHRAAGRYGDGELALPEGRLLALLAATQEMLELAEARAGIDESPLGTGCEESV